MFPTTVSPTIALSGTMTTIDLSAGGLVPAVGGTIALYVAEGGPPQLGALGGPTTAAGEWFVGPVSASSPLDGYVHAELAAPMSGDRPTVLYPAKQLTRDESALSIFTPRTSDLNNLLNFAGITQDPMLGLLHIRVVDCAGTPVDGAALTLTPSGGGVPVGEFLPNAQNYLGPGTYFALNIPPGLTRVTANFDGMTFLAPTIPIAFGQTTAVVLRPGY